MFFYYIIILNIPYKSFSDHFGFEASIEKKNQQIRNKQMMSAN